MTFTTATFLIFLLIVFVVYWRLQDRTRQNMLLIVAGYIFYGWWSVRFCSLLLASSLADYTFGRLLARAEKTSSRRAILVASCAFNLGLLGFFKYYNFFADSFNGLFHALGWRLDFPTTHIILPAGISFYTFQSMSYVIDVYRRELQPTRSLLDYMSYVSFFPQLLAGPIERGKNLLPQILRPRSFDYALAVDGLRLILWGFFKKMALADNLAVFVDQAYQHPANFNGPRLALATVFFAFQIYGDFSAYSDIAIGTARLFGVKLMRNFAYPYFSQSVSEFWRRWHISLSSWFRDYLFLPLGGSRVSRPRLVFNIMATFVVSGLWHGAAWTYVVWGALNGLGILPAALWSKERITSNMIPGGAGFFPRPGTALRLLSTFAFICVTWVFFRARSFGDVYLIWSKVFTWPILPQQSLEFTPAFVSTGGMIWLVSVFVVVEWLSRHRLHPLEWGRLPRIARWSGYTALIWLTLYLRTWQSGTFIYFRF